MAWLPFRDEYLHEMLWVEGHRGMGDSCAGCGGFLEWYIAALKRNASVEG